MMNVCAMRRVKRELWTVRAMKLWRIETEIQTEEWTKVCAWERLDVQTERTGAVCMISDDVNG